MSERVPRLYVILEGGCVQCVASDDPSAFAGVEVVVIDYDAEGADAADITPVCQGDGSHANAIIGRWPVEALNITLPTLMRGGC